MKYFCDAMCLLCSSKGNLIIDLFLHSLRKFLFYLVPLLYVFFFIVIFIYYPNVMNFEEEANLQNFSLAEFELPCVSGRPR